VLTVVLIGVATITTKIEKGIISLYCRSVRCFLPLQDFRNGEDLVIPATTELLGAFNDAT
jgi:hypothetical protein